MPPARSFRLLEQAEQERDREVDYNDGQSFGLGLTFFEAYEDALAYAIEQPHAGSPFLHRRIRRTIRKYRIGRFDQDLVVTLESDELIVLAVSHHKRRPGYWLRRLKHL